MRKINIGLFRVLSLAAGLAVGLVLIAKISFENSFEKFYPDYQNIYCIWEQYAHSSDDPMSSSHTPGAVAYYMGQDIPQIKWATRFTGIDGSIEIVIEGERERMGASAILADTNYFKVLSRPILAGDPVEVLSNRNKVMVSRTVAEMLGGIDQALGQLIFQTTQPDKPYEVAGIFEDIPENSSYPVDIIFSLDNMSRGSTDNWIGNDRYLSYVLLYLGTDPASLEPAIRDLENRYLPIEALRQADTEYHFYLTPFTAAHSEESRQSNLLLGTVAALLILAAVMNYIMIIISSLVGRAKSIAVRRCYGAGNRTIMGIAFKESLIHLALALVLAALLVLAFRDTVEEIMMTSLEALFSPRSLGVLAATVACVLLLAAYIPGRAFQSIPIAVAFRNYVDSKRLWKRILLFAQVTLASLLLTLLCFVALQMNQWMHADPGYDYEQLLYCYIDELPEQTQVSLQQAIRSVPGVEDTGMAEETLLYTVSGNSVYLPGDPRELFNCADLYEASPNWASLMGINIIEGRNFATPQEIMVNPDFAKRICEIAGWKDGAIGKQVRFTEHGGPYTIVGVFEDICVGTVIEEDTRPHILFYSEEPCSYLIVRASRVTPELIAAVQGAIRSIVPKDYYIESYTASIADIYRPAATLRESILIAGIVTLIIALIGLIGYTTDKTNRRRKEIALRKINGAQPRQITALFLHDIGALALVAVLIGSVASWFTFQLLLRSFAQKATVPIALFLVVAVVLLAILASVVILRCRAISRANPADSLRTE